MDFKKFKIVGPKLNQQTPLWEAGLDGDEIEIVEWHDQHGHFRDYRTVRHLFLNRAEIVLNEAGGDARRKVLMPGTMLALCRIKNVRFNFGGARFVWRETDRKICHARLLLQAKPEDWIKGDSPNQELRLPTTVCVGGEIDLNLLELREGDPSDLARIFAPAIGDAKNFRLHAGGLSFEGKCSFDWQDASANPDKKDFHNPIDAAFFATTFFRDKSPAPPASNDLFVTLDRDLMTAKRKTRADWDKSLGNLRDTFQDLARIFKQNPSDKPEEIYWASLEAVSRTDIPQFHWTISPAIPSQPKKTALDFERGEWQIVVADQKPAESDVAPRGVLTIAPPIRVVKTGGSLKVKFEELNGADQSKIFALEAVKDIPTATWSETAKIINVTTEYESLFAAEILRRQYDLPAPEEDSPRPVEPTILWGFLPLADGWAQLPFLNLTEQHYFDALPQNKPPVSKSPMLVGAAVFGNDAPETYLPGDGENPWSVTLLDGKGYRGEWTIDAARRELVKRELKIFAPDLVLNGFLRLGTQPPSRRDALPSFDNWLTDLRAISLRTSRAEDKFPAPFCLHFNSLEFKNQRKEQIAKDSSVKIFSAPALESWQFVYQINDLKTELDNREFFELILTEGVWRNLTEEKRLKKLENLWRHQPIVWRRHPTAPAVQALPLTQTQIPPSFPSPSRQLAPFEFVLKKRSDASASAAIFGTGEGAKNWGHWLAPHQTVESNQEWRKDKRFLYLAALGVPGLVFDPNVAADFFGTSGDFLPAQLLYDLPYTDEINALAQLPKDEKSNQVAQSQLQDAPPEKPVPALRRELYDAHWQTLAEKAALAKADADEALRQTASGKTAVQNLIEPLEWTVKTRLDIADYPGKLTLTDDENGRAIELSGDAALRGIEGKFSSEFTIDNQKLLLVDETAENAFEIVAGTMNAHGDGNGLRDQRGWRRGATLQQPRLLKTALERQGGQSFALCTLLDALELKIAGGAAWQFWFRDLPVLQLENIFSRSKMLSANGSQAEDANDPAAVSSKLNALTGYEWRLAERGSESLNLLGFDFFPLALEKVEFADDGSGASMPKALEIVGRIQLPAAGEIENPELGNVVRVRFERAAPLSSPASADFHLTSVKSKPGDAPGDAEIGGIWTLYPEREFFSPRLHWRNFEYSPTDNKIRLAASLEFYLFDARWLVPLTIPPFTAGESVTMITPAPQGAKEIRLAEVSLKLNRALQPEFLKVKIEFDLGAAGERVAGAIVVFDLQKTNLSGAVNLLENDGSLLEFFWVTKKEDGTEKKIVFNAPKKRASLTGGALQIEFSGINKSGAADNFQLLPAMSLAAGDDACKGFAVAYFDVVPHGESSDFKLNYGGLETVFDCSWGERLPSIGELKDGKASKEQIFGSSSGDLSAGYTLSKTGENVWQWSLLLNGVVEINNLISYPPTPVQLPPNLGAVRFESNEYEVEKIIAEDRHILPELAAFLKDVKNAELRLSLEGHADTGGKHDKNLDLSKQRADAVSEKLNSLGVAENRLTAVGFGETMPRGTNETDEGMENNRRVEFHPSLAFLPAVRPVSDPNAPLNHVRHILRVLLNQHEIQSAALTRGRDNLFFDFDKDAAWQFLAVVEHRLLDVSFVSSGTAPEVLRESRWAAVQEIRFAAPKKFSAYLSEFFHIGTPKKDRIHGTFPATEDFKEKELTRINAAFLYKPLLKKLLPPDAKGKNQITKLENALLVEASAIHEILSRPNESAAFTNLQFLPHGVEQAIVSIPADFAPNADESGKLSDWALISLPFLGRLQSAENDFTGDGDISPQTSLLAADPILYLDKKRRANPPPSSLELVPLSLASRGDRANVEVKISLFDLTRFRRFNNLDPTTLVESWFRLQHPPREQNQASSSGGGSGDKLPSVLSALPADSPARASRPTLLRRLFDERRKNFPPTSEDLSGDEPSPSGKIIWRRNSLLSFQGLSDLMVAEIGDDNEDDAPVLSRPYGFYFAAAQIHSLGLGAPEKKSARFAAVTLLPANLKIDQFINEVPVGFAVSPYLGFEFVSLRGSETERFPALVFAELLCLDQTGKKLTAVASRTWEREELAGEVEPTLKIWGAEIKNRLAADSVLAVLRVRQVFAVKRTDESQTVDVSYRFFTIAAEQTVSPVVEGSSPLRLSLEKLRFVEGQFGGNKIPSVFASFEIAPPQISAVQAIYIERKDWNDVAENEFNKWRWNFSAMRFGVNFTNSKTGIVGATKENGGARRLWWHAVSQQTQFAQPPDIAKLLPFKFRAKSVNSLLPVFSRLPLPENLKKVLGEFDSSAASSPEFDYWQPILPGAINYLLVGARAGVPFAFRNLLLRQELDENHCDRNKGIAAIVAGGIPVQHRFPRPVALPKNPPAPTEAAPNDALQTWGSYFEPQKTLKPMPNPQDNAFVVKGENEAHELHIALAQPSGGIVATNSDGKFWLELSGQPISEELRKWKFSAELSFNERKLPLNYIQSDFAGNLCICFAPEKVGETREQGAEKMRQFLADSLHGASLKLSVAVLPPKELVEMENYNQTLVFPLRLAKADNLREPLGYRFIQFEDPQYNRRLVTPAAQANRTILLIQAADARADSPKSAEVLFAADRRQYNADSEILLAVFGNSPKKRDSLDVEGVITFKKIAARSDEKDVTLNEPISLKGFGVFSLNDLTAKTATRLNAGDILLVSFQPDNVGDSTADSSTAAIEMQLEIVAQPVTPVPSAAYALLRRKQGQRAVECVRFAWSPPATRIELLNPLDLKGGTVRRRAVFQWVDISRLTTEYEYGLQKLTASGSTHFDIFDAS